VESSGPGGVIWNAPIERLPPAIATVLFCTTCRVRAQRDSRHSWEFGWKSTNRSYIRREPGCAICYRRDLEEQARQNAAWARKACPPLTWFVKAVVRDVDARDLTKQQQCMFVVLWAVD